jgi:hemerythrin
MNLDSFGWRSNYELGNDHIDGEHRIILGLIKKLAEDIGSNRHRDRVLRTFAEVVKYAEFHFLSEENLMLDVGYPDYAAHHALHEELLGELRRHRQDYEQDRIDLLAVVQFLLEWFVRHTVSEDVKIGAFMADAERKGTLPA